MKKRTNRSESTANRCAIYTRKSTNEGLDQDFNTLDAQRESGEAYIASMKNEGWVCIATRYDDGGFTGGNMERPAIQRLMADIEAGKIDCVIVYKVDRLSRSLLDFSRIIETFDNHGVSFVSVTQQFNTTSSMGRLTLNILLSFAQFEREIISERTRDKMAAARRRGKYVGGAPILGYDIDRDVSRLVVNETEANRVRQIFKLYLEHQSLLSTIAELDRRGWTTKRWTTKKGKERGGRPFNKNTLYGLLTNVTYLGKIRYKDEVYEGEHEAIVDPETFEDVQRLLTEDTEANRRIEREFSRWSQTIGLAEKLRTLRMGCAADGETFAILINNEHLSTSIKLDLRLVEADQITTPDLSILTNDNAVDGIVFDAAGNPVEYHVLRTHPGDPRGTARLDYDHIPAESVIHLFRGDRPGQRRGVPEITPALPLFAMLRDYSLATLDAAKAAAYFAGILYTDAPASGEAESVEPLDSIELDRNLLLTMPGGWKMSQLKAEHPSGTYAEFKHEILNEIARCLNMPFNIAAGNSSGYNYASGRLDHQTYFKAIRINQAHIESVVLDRLLAAWFDEAVLLPGLLPAGVGPIAEWPHQWFWDGHEHVDPAKEANAQATRLANHTTTLADEYARRGQDWENQLRQRATEIGLMRELGLTPAEVTPANDTEESVDEEETETAKTA